MTTALLGAAVFPSARAAAEVALDTSIGDEEAYTETGATPETSIGDEESTAGIDTSTATGDENGNVTEAAGTESSLGDEVGGMGVGTESSWGDEGGMFGAGTESSQGDEGDGAGVASEFSLGGEGEGSSVGGESSLGDEDEGGGAGISVESSLGDETETASVNVETSLGDEGQGAGVEEESSQGDEGSVGTGGDGNGTGGNGNNNGGGNTGNGSGGNSGNGGNGIGNNGGNGGSTTLPPPIQNPPPQPSAVQQGGSGGGGGGGAGSYPLTISNASVVPAGRNAAKVWWYTNMPVTSRLAYGTTSAGVLEGAPRYGYGHATERTSVATTTHVFVVGGLETGRPLFFRPVAYRPGYTDTLGPELTFTLPALTEVNGSSSCAPYLSAYLRRGNENSPQEVLRLQIFLNAREGASLPLSGVFDGATEAAVHAFQTKYAHDILKPWGENERSTGFVYITTLQKINSLVCGTPLERSTEEESVLEAYHRRAEVPVPARESVPSTEDRSAPTPTEEPFIIGGAPTASSSLAAIFYGALLREALWALAVLTALAALLVLFIHLRRRRAERAARDTFARMREL